MTKTAALILAAGNGSRMDTRQPKPYVDVGGRTVLQLAVQAFLGHPDVDWVVVVVRPQDRTLYENLFPHQDCVETIFGGARRQDSVRLGLEHLVCRAPSRVLIHDAARPFVSESLLRNLLEGLQRSPCVVPVLLVVDALRREIPPEQVVSQRTTSEQMVATQTASRRMVSAQMTPHKPPPDEWSPHRWRTDRRLPDEWSPHRWRPNRRPPDEWSPSR